MAIWIVGGYMRSLTSMMCQCLQAGGMDVAYSAERDKSMNDRWGDPDYLPNKNYLELDVEEYRDPTFPEKHEGRVVKCLDIGPLLLRPTTDFHAVIMRRAQDEIKASVAAFFHNQNDKIRSPYFQLRMDKLVECLRDRRSFKSVTVVWADDILAWPEGTFYELIEAGWPITDVDAACRIPDPGKRRFSSAQLGLPIKERMALCKN